MKKQRMGGASVGDVKCDHAGNVTVYVVDQDVVGKNDSTAMW